MHSATTCPHPHKLVIVSKPQVFLSVEKEKERHLPPRIPMRTQWDNLSKMLGNHPFQASLVLGNPLLLQRHLKPLWFLILHIMPRFSSGNLQDLLFIPYSETDMPRYESVFIHWLDVGWDLSIWGCVCFDVGK